MIICLLVLFSWSPVPFFLFATVLLFNDTSWSFTPWVENLPKSFWLHNYNISLTADNALSIPRAESIALQLVWAHWARSEQELQTLQKSLFKVHFYNVAIHVVGQFVTELIQKTRSSLLWHYVLLTLQGKEIKHKHSFLGHSSAANFWEEIRLWPSWGFISVPPAWLHPCFRCSFNSGFQSFPHMSSTAIATSLHLEHLPAYQPFSLLLVKHLCSWDCFQHTAPSQNLCLSKASTSRSSQGAQKSQAYKMEEWSTSHGDCTYHYQSIKHKNRTVSLHIYS